MAQETVFKTVHQYNREPVPESDMEKLEGIAKDYCSVKNYVYQRYSGINSLPKLYPGYTIQNEMTGSGLRSRLGLPSVFFYCAIFDALGDIKSQWSYTKNRIEKSIKENPSLTPEERHYLRFIMRQSQCFEAVLLDKEIALGKGWQEKYDGVRVGVDEHRLHRYMRRQVRKHLHRPCTDVADGFSVTGKGYRYGDNGKGHGIYISTKENRKRVFVPLTDNNCYNRQLYIRLYPDEGRIKIDIPVEIKIKTSPGYCNEIGVVMGMTEMLVTDKGNIYGGRVSIHQEALTEHVREGLASYRRNRQNNPGRKKYSTKKKKLEAALHTYINAEINRMLKAEKPKVIYVPKLPPAQKAGINKKINNSVSMWQRGYIRRRLTQKCRECSVELKEVFAKDISRECSACGSIGKKTKELFTCEVCGMQMPERANAARNALKRGRDKKAERFMMEDATDKCSEQQHFTGTGKSG